MKNRRDGFTILELLLVVAVIAIIATLATGAAVKAIRNGREKRIDTMITTLEMAITTYRVQKGVWPFKLDGIKSDGTKEWKGKDNAQVFTKLYETSGASRGYLDCSGFFTDKIDEKGRRRLRLSEVPEGSRRNLPLGYPDPNDQNRFKYFNIRYSQITDRVKVTR